MALPLMLAGAGINLGSKLLGGIFGRKKKPPTNPTDPWDQEFQQAVGYEKQQRNKYAQEYDEGMEGAEGAWDSVSGFKPRDFNAGAAYKEYAGGVMSDFNKVLGDNVRKMKESGAGAGRLDTGMWEQDTGDVMTETARGFSSDLARQALGAASIDSNAIGRADDLRLRALSTGAQGTSNLQGLRYGAMESSGNRYLDTLTGATNRQIQKQNAAQQSSDARRKGIFDFIGGAAKTVLPYVLKNNTVGGTPTPKKINLSW